MVFEFTEYRAFLKVVLVNKMTKNASYSLRAMASALSVSPGLLSGLLNEKKHISYERAMDISDRLGLSPSEREYFCLMVQFETTKNPKVKQELQEKLQLLNPKRQIADLSVDVFTAISEWYHLPILMLTDVDGFTGEAAQISQKLGITLWEAKAALDRLLRLELLERDEKGKLRRVHQNSIFRSKAAHQGLRHFHKQMLEKAIEALETQDNKEKYIGSETFAVDREGLEESRQMARRFLSRMVELSSKAKKKTDVYHLNVQFFKLTKGEN